MASSKMVNGMWSNGGSSNIFYFVSILVILIDIYASYHLYHVILGFT